MFEALAAWLPSCQADVVCLQEVTRTPGASGWTEFGDGRRTLPQRADLFGDVAALLPRHQGHFLVSDTGPVRDAHGQVRPQHFGIATFVHERVPVVGVSSTFVHGSYADHAAWTLPDRPRVAHGVRLTERSTGTTSTVVQLHGLHDPAGKGDTPARRMQAERIADLVSMTAAADDIVVVCGDLNLLPGSETFGILGRLGLSDLVGDADTRTSRYPKPVRHASYMLVSDPSVVRGFDIVAAPEVSDHRPLLLDL